MQLSLEHLHKYLGTYQILNLINLTSTPNFAVYTAQLL